MALLALFVLPVLFLLTAQVESTFTDSAGRKVTVPAPVQRVFAAGPPAGVLLYALAPDKLIGWPRALDAEENLSRCSR